MQANLNVEKTKNILTQTKQGIDLERTAAKNALLNSLTSLQAQEDNMNLAQKVYNTEKKKFEAGLSNSFAVLMADTQLQQSQANYFKALYDAVIAKVSFLKATGKL